jgi:exonuclease III
VDAFRLCHGASRGAYTYWSTRANGRPDNKGLRLDYFVCSRSLSAGVAPAQNETAQAAVGAAEEAAVSEEATVYRIADSYCLPDATKTSDHCPVALVLEMR